MAEQEHQVKIVTWPEEAAKLEHGFDSDKPCPVLITFEDKPANVFIQTNPRQPLHVDMAMNVQLKRLSRYVSSSVNQSVPRVTILSESLSLIDQYQLSRLVA